MEQRAPTDRSLPVTAIVATRNEAVNIGRCLESLRPAARVIVLDSGSTDGTDAIARSAGAEVLQFRYRGGYPKKRQWAIDTLSFATPWILLVDADEQIPPPLWDEIAAATRAVDGPTAYFIRKGFHFLGRRFRYGGFSFDALLLFRTGQARFEHLVDDDPSGMDMEIHERLIVDGTTASLRTPLIHDDFKRLDSYIDKHNRYSSWEARLRFDFLRTGRWGLESVRPRLFGNPQERRRFLKFIALRLPFEPALWFTYHFLVRGGFLEGIRGYIACRIRAAYIAAVRAKMYELRIRERDLQ
ncbi:MAG: glycosyltransferase family 2 protein [Planctomycetia bacterium]|nr:glycosyltransferase family 2 protein [Planctomycetia bacterium]